jgi:hypothetical protein
VHTCVYFFIERGDIMATKNKRVVVYLTEENEKYIMSMCEHLSIPVSSCLNKIIAEHEETSKQLLECYRSDKPVMVELKVVNVSNGGNVYLPSEIKEPIQN